MRGLGLPRMEGKLLTAAVNSLNIPFSRCRCYLSGCYFYNIAPKVSCHGFVYNVQICFFFLFRCTAINFLMKRMPLQWVIEHQLSFINALCFVMMDLTNEVSQNCWIISKIFLLYV